MVREGHKTLPKLKGKIMKKILTGITVLAFGLLGLVATPANATTVKTAVVPSVIGNFIRVHCPTTKALEELGCPSVYRVQQAGFKAVDKCNFAPSDLRTVDRETDDAYSANPKVSVAGKREPLGSSVYLWCTGE